LPRKLQIEFSRVIQGHTDIAGGEIGSEKIWQIFQDEYLPAGIDQPKWGRFELTKMRTESDMDGVVQIEVVMRDGDSEFSAASSGNGPISAFIAILQDKGVEIRLLDYVEHTLSAGGDALAAAYIELEVDGNVLWGVGVDGDIATASLKALISSTNRALRTAVTS